MKKLLLASAALLPFFGVFAEDAASISKRFAGEKAKALETYLQSNPKAEDAKDAEMMLVECYEQTSEKDKLSTLLAKMYDGIAKGAEGDLQSGAQFTAMRIEHAEKAKAKEILATFKKDFEKHPDFSKAESFIERLESKLGLPGVGEAMEIAFKGLNGEDVDLSKMKDKVVLVDFWATWCGPCVGELPNVKKAYAAYHEKGFEVIGISLDQEEAKLKDFIKKQAMPWAQNFDGKGWQNALAQKFGIQSIPATFLVGKDGKIVATDLRGPALEAKLAELLK